MVIEKLTSEYVLKCKLKNECIVIDDYLGDSTSRLFKVLVQLNIISYLREHYAFSGYIGSEYVVNQPVRYDFNNAIWDLEKGNFIVIFGGEMVRQYIGNANAL